MSPPVFPTRLMDTRTGEFVYSAILIKNDMMPYYAILSHVWDYRGEQSYTDIREIQAAVRSQPQTTTRLRKLRRKKPTPSPVPLNSCLDHPMMSKKVRSACALAWAQGYEYIWIDSCCIDKSSSMELSEAINSMYNWYRKAAVCYAYLADVPSNQNPRAVNPRSLGTFSGSIWFKRGWTLQELLAPRAVVFFSKDWKIIGTKSGLADIIESITDIPISVLTHRTSIREVSVAQRMSWASERSTTRVEDEAYSLMGIFDISMPTLYGEGSRAFRRLQEEILRRIPDQTLFAWGSSVASPANPERQYSPSERALRHRAVLYSEESFFATSVSLFASSGNFRSISHDELTSRLAIHAGTRIPFPNYTASSHGVHARLPLLTHSLHPGQGSSDAPLEAYLLILACELFHGSLVAVACQTPNALESAQRERISIGLALQGGRVRRPTYRDSANNSGRLLVLSPEELDIVRKSMFMQDVFLDTGYFWDPPNWERNVPSIQHWHVSLAPWSRESLRNVGYMVAHNRQNGRAVSASLILSNGEEYVDIDVGPVRFWPVKHSPLTWVDSNTTLREVRASRLRLLTTVAVALDSTRGDYYTYKGYTEFLSPSGVPGTCDVTISMSDEAKLVLLDITLAHNPPVQPS